MTLFLGLFLLIPLVAYGASIGLGEDCGSPGDTVTIPIILSYSKGEMPNICSIKGSIGMNLNNLLCEEELSKQPLRIPPCENDEGITKNRSHFPEHPELFQPMPIPDPTKKPRKPSKDRPEVPESHTTGNGKLQSSGQANGKLPSPSHISIKEHGRLKK